MSILMPKSGRRLRRLLEPLGVTLVILASGRAAHATNYTITVDVSKQTAGNPRFWTASVGTGTAALTLRSDLQTHYKIGNREIGFQRVRGHGVLSDDIGIYQGPGSYSWTNFDKYLDAIVSAGMRPIMETSFMPNALGSDSTNPGKSPPKDYATYKQFIQAVVQHCVDRYGAADVGQWYWEIWNEPDYPGFWTQTMTEYYTLYDNAVDAITAVLPNALVGGPATTYYGPIGAFLQHCKSANKRVTFVSSHAYPGGGPAASANATSLVSDNDSRIGQITSGGYTTAQLKSFNTEWNSSYSGQGGQVGDDLTSMDNHWNAGFILKGIKLLSDKDSGDTPPLDVFSYWVLSDVFDESGGPSGSYILGQGGNLPFGRVFGLMTLQGMRKASFNAFKMLAYLGPKRLMSGGGTGSDGVDAMATMSASNDEVQILVYDTYATLNTTGTDMVTVTLNNLPTALAGKELFLTHFRVDETHSNPYSTWTSQSSPTNPTEAQWQAMKAHQHLELLQPVSKVTVSGTTYTTSFSIPRQAGSLVILGVNRPVTGRNGLVEIEGEDYDGQSGATKQDSGDTTLGQSITAGSGSYVFFDNVDFSDAGVNAVQLRVNAQSATTLSCGRIRRPARCSARARWPPRADPGRRRHARSRRRRVSTPYTLFLAARLASTTSSSNSRAPRREPAAWGAAPRAGAGAPAAARASAAGRRASAAARALAAGRPGLAAPARASRAWGCPVAAAPGLAASGGRPAVAAAVPGRAGTAPSARAGTTARASAAIPVREGRRPPPAGAAALAASLRAAGRRWLCQPG